MKKNIIIRRISSAGMAVVLTVTTCLTSAPSIVKASDFDKDDFVAYVNGRNASETGDNIATVKYGAVPELSVYLAGEEPGESEPWDNSKVDYFYLSTDACEPEDIINSEMETFPTDRVLISPGTYYLDTVIKTGANERVDINDGRFTFAVTKVELSIPDSLSWETNTDTGEDTIASWSAVDTTVTGYGVSSAVIDKYAVRLFKDGTDEPIGTYYTANGATTSLDLGEYIVAAGYGKYTFDVTAIAKTSDYYLSSEGYSDASSTKCVYKDKVAPEIVEFAKGSGDNLNISVQDAGSDVKAFAVTTKSSASELVDGDWTAINNPDPNEPFEAVVPISAMGTYYLYVKDGDNVDPEDENITQSSNHITVSKVNVVYNSDNESNSNHFIYYDSADASNPGKYLLNSNPSKTGYSFNSWTGTGVANNTVNEETVYFITATDTVTEYTASATWNRTEFSVSWRPRSEGISVNKVYNGHSTRITLDSTDTGLATAYRLYHAGDEESEGTEITSGHGIQTSGSSFSFTVKDVSDSGYYYVVATNGTGDDASTVTSERVSVNISKADLHVNVSNINLTFGDDLNTVEPVYSYDTTDLKNSETIQGLINSGKLTVGTFSTDYVKGSDVGSSYTITNSGFDAVNYRLIVNTATVVVTPKNINEVEDVVISITTPAQRDGGYIYTGSDVRPEVSVTDNAIGEEPVVLTNQDYILSYNNNVLVTSAGSKATVTVEMQGNYTGTKTLEFDIVKAELSSDDTTINVTSIPDGESENNWTYGETNINITYSNIPAGTVITNKFRRVYRDENGDVDHYGEETEEVPVDAGEYEAWTEYEESDLYLAYETPKVPFTIEKRVIKITVDGGEWPYDGNPHSATNYTITEGTVVGTDSIKNIQITGSVTNVNEPGRSSVVVNFSQSTNIDNYDVQVTEGDLRVTAQRLPLPVSFGWSETDPGYASWIAVGRAGVNVNYTVKLYRDMALEDVLIASETTEHGETGFDFSEAIRTDSMTAIEEGYTDVPYSYYFKVTVLPDSGNNNYMESVTSSASGKLYTLLVETQDGIEYGVSKTAIDEDIEHDSPATSKVLIAGETARINAQAAAGYSLSDIVWESSALGGGDSHITIVSPSRASTDIIVDSSLLASGVTYLSASADNDLPRIISLTGTNNRNSDYQNVTLNYMTTDAGIVEYYAFAPFGAPDDVLPNNLGAWLTAESAQDPTKEIEWIATNDDGGAYDNAVTVNATGTYYLWIMDDSGNIVCSDNPVNIYELTFNNGSSEVEGEITGEMITSVTGEGTVDYYLLADHTVITLPQNQYVLSEYQFIGWKSNNGPIYADEAYYAENSNTTLTAQWTNIEVPYTVNIYFANEVQEYDDQPSITATYSGIAGSTVTAASLLGTYEGYVTDNTKTENSASIVLSESASEEQVINLYYMTKEYDITYSYVHPDTGNTVLHTETYHYKEVLYDEDNNIDLEYAKPDISGCTFIGWIYNESGTRPVTMPYHDISATGWFTTDIAEVQVAYYTQNLQNNQTITDTYSLAGEYSEILKANHGDTVKFENGNIIITGTDNATGDPVVSTTAIKDIEGFTFAGGKIAYSLDANRPNDIATSWSDVSVSYAEDAEGNLIPYVHVNLYYTRNQYDLRLKVYLGDRTRGRIAYSHTEQLYYQQVIPTGFESYERFAVEDTQMQNDLWLEAYGNEHPTEDISRYSLANYADWSMGTQIVGSTSSMPAGDVVVTRQYIDAYEAPFRVMIYAQNANQTYDYCTTYTYYDYKGSSIKIGADSGEHPEVDKFIPASTLLSAMGHNKDYYEYTSNPNSIETGTVNGDGTTVLRVYFNRKTVKAKITYVYDDNESNDGEGEITFATVIKEGIWGSEFNIEPLRYYESGESNANSDSVSSNITRILVESDDPEVRAAQAVARDKNYKGTYGEEDDKYVVTYKGQYYFNDRYNYPSRKYYEANDLTAHAGDRTYFGQFEDSADLSKPNAYATTIVVAYTKADRNQTYCIDMMIEPSRGSQRYSLNYYNEFVDENEATNGTGTFPYPKTSNETSEGKLFPMTVTIGSDDPENPGSTTYNVRVANKADIYLVEGVNVNLSTDELTQYPALSNLNWVWEAKAGIRDNTAETTYTYNTDEVGGSESHTGYQRYQIEDVVYFIKDGFTPITLGPSVDKRTYFLHNEDGTDYIYAVNEKNDFIVGQRPSFTYINNIKHNDDTVLGYNTSTWTEIGTNGSLGTSEDVINTIYNPYKASSVDPKASGVSVYDSGYDTLVTAENIGGVHRECIRFENALEPDNIHYVLDGITYDTHHEDGYIVNDIDTEDLTVNDEYVFAQKEGYHPVWYTSPDFTGSSVTTYTTDGEMTFYGRYEKNTVNNIAYIYYQLPNEITLEDAVDENDETISISYLTEDYLEDSIFVDTAQEAEGTDKHVLEMQTYDGIEYYTIDGNPALIKKIMPGQIKSEIEFDYTETDTHLGCSYNQVNGFRYSQTNTDNILMGYTDLTPINLHAYMERVPHTFTIVYDNSDVANNVDVRTVYGQRVDADSISNQTQWDIAPTKEGYIFDGWEFYEISEEENEQHEIVTTETLMSEYTTSASSDSVFVVMPNNDVVARAQWIADIFPVKDTIYFPNKLGKYESTAVEGFRADNSSLYESVIDSSVSSDSENAVDIEYEGDDYTGYLASGIIIFEIDITNHIFVYLKESDITKISDANVNERAKYSADLSNVIATEKTVTLSSDVEYNVSDYNSMIDTELHTYDNTRIIYKHDSETVRGGTFVSEYGMQMDHFLVANPITVTIQPKVTDNIVDTPGNTGFFGESNYAITATGDGRYNTEYVITAAANAGFRFVGWYDAASGILDGNGDVVSNYSAIEKFCNTANYSFYLKEDKDLVALFEPTIISEATVTISGKSNYAYAYPQSGSNVLNAAVSITSIDSVTGKTIPYEVVSYTWKRYDADTDSYVTLDDGSNATYNFPLGVGVGSYNYICEVTIRNKDNGRVSSFSSLDTSDPANRGYTVTVGKSTYVPKVNNYEGIYDGEAHNIEVTLDSSKYNPSTYEIYYSREPLTSDNYDSTDENGDPIAYTSAQDVLDHIGYTDVAVDSNTNPVAQPIYFYIHSIDGNVTDYSSADENVVSTVTITPKTITLSPLGTFTKVYDGTANIDPDAPYSAALKDGNGTIYNISGLCNAASEIGNTYSIDFTNATFNSAHVADATGATIEGLSLCNNGEASYNYIFKSGYRFTFSGSITPLNVNVVWDNDNIDNNEVGEFTYIYNGQIQGPRAKLVSEAGDLPDDVNVTTVGHQTYAGNNYTATAQIAESNSYQSSDYAVNPLSATQLFSISRRSVNIVPRSKTVTYDGNEHTLDEFDLIDPNGSVAPLAPGVTIGFEATSNASYTNAGTYYIAARNPIKVLEHNTLTGKDTDTTENYDITYGTTGTLTINRKIATISGIAGVDKSYDTGVSAELDFSGITLDGILDGDTVSVDTTEITGTFVDPAASLEANSFQTGITLSYDMNNGSYTALTGADAGNYTLTFDNENSGLNSQSTTSARINKAVVKVYITVADTVYGDSFANTYTVNYDDPVTYTGEETHSVNGEITYTVNNDAQATTKYNNQRLDVNNGTPYDMLPDLSDLEMLINDTHSDNYEFALYDAANHNTPVDTIELVITKRIIDIEKTDNVFTKTYDGTISADNSAVIAEQYPSSDAYYTFIPYQGRDVLSGDEVYVDGCNASFDNRNATVFDSNDDYASGAKEVNLTGLTISNPNYDLAEKTLDIDGRIMPKDISIQAKNKNIVYGGTTPAFELSSDSIAQLATIDRTGNIENLLNIEYACAYDRTVPANRNVGQYPITVSFRDETRNTNYNVSLVNDDVETVAIEGGKLTVTSAPLTITAVDKSMVYGENVPANDIEITGWIEGFDDDVAIASGEDTNTDAIKNAAAGGYSYRVGSTPITVAYNTVAGTYSIVPSISGSTSFMDGNYNVQTFVPGNLTINKRNIYFTGVTVDDKVYDGTTSVSSDAIHLENIHYNTTLLPDSNGIINEDVAVLSSLGQAPGVTVTGVYADYNVDEDIVVALSYTLGDYLDARYVLGASDNATADITPRVVVMKANNLNVKYGDTNPAYTYSFLTEEFGDENVFMREADQSTVVADIGAVTYTAISTADGTTPYSNIAEKGSQFTVTPVGANVNDPVNGTVLGNYKVKTAPGTLTVVENTFATPKVWWKSIVAENEDPAESDIPAQVAWTEVDGISAINVDHYILSLYKDGNKVDIVDSNGVRFREDGDYHFDVSADPSVDLTYDMRDSIRYAGKGAYTVTVKAAQSDSITISVNDSEIFNDGREYAGITPTNVYAKNVTTVFKNDAPTNRGKLVENETDMAYTAPNMAAVTGGSATATYVMIEGESAITYAKIQNSTGYTISASSSSSDLTLAKTTENVGTAELTDTFTSDITLSRTLTNSNDITVTVKLNYVAATLTVATSSDWVGPLNVPFGYVRVQTQESEDRGAYTAPVFTATTDVDAADTVEVDGYRYTYTWSLKDHTKQYRTVSGPVSKTTPSNDTDSWQLEENLGVMGGYAVKVVVTAERLDNGQTKTVTKYINFNVVQAELTDKITYLPSEIEWYYGETRRLTDLAPYGNLGLADMEHENLYQYAPVKTETVDGLTQEQADNKESNAGWTTGLPQEVGTYYVRANIPNTANYKPFTTKAKVVEVLQNQLSTPEVSMDNPSPTNPNYGIATWPAVLTATSTKTTAVTRINEADTFKENRGVNSSPYLASTQANISVSYNVILEKENELTHEFATVHTFTSAEMTFDEDTGIHSVDYTKYIEETGTYRINVVAISSDGESIANSEEGIDSDFLLVVDGVISIQGVLENQKEKIYDGSDVVIIDTLRCDPDDISDDAEFKWYKDSELVAVIKKNNVGTYDVRNASNELLTTTTDTNLHIWNVADSGRYTCVVEDGNKEYVGTYVDVTILPAVAQITWNYDDGITHSCPDSDMEYTGLTHYVTGTVTGIVSGYDTGNNEEVVVPLRTSTTSVWDSVGDTFNYTYASKTEGNYKYTNNAVEVADNYISQITDIDNPNFILEAPQSGTYADMYAGISDSHTTKPWTISYHTTSELPNISAGTLGTNQWFTSDTVTIHAPSGYTICVHTGGELCADRSGEYAESFTVNRQGTTSISYHLKQDDTGRITDVMNDVYWDTYATAAGVTANATTNIIKIDKVDPTGTITLNGNTYSGNAETSPNKVFVKDSTSFTIDTNDAINSNSGEVLPGTYAPSHVQYTYYQIADESNPYDVNGTWTPYTSEIDSTVDSKLTANNKLVVYAKIIDYSGRTTIINSEGVVVYTDAAQDTEEISYTRTTLVDKTATVTLNGNTRKSVYISEALIGDNYGSDTLLEFGNDYSEPTAGTLVFDGDFLDTLPKGTYRITVKYNPYGDTFFTDNQNNHSGNADAADTYITLNVTKADLSIKLNNTTYADTYDDQSKIYDGDRVNQQPRQVKDISKNAYFANDSSLPDHAAISVVYEGTTKGGITYGPTSDRPIDAGDYTVTLSIAENAYYNETSVTESFEICPAVAEITWYQKRSSSHAAELFDVDGNRGNLTYNGLTQSVYGVVTPIDREDSAVDTFEYTYTTTGTTAGRTYARDAIVVGNYKSVITDIGNTNYTLTRRAEGDYVSLYDAAYDADSDVSRDWSIRYLDYNGIATITDGTLGDNQWFTNEPVKFQAPDGYEIAWKEAVYGREANADLSQFTNTNDKLTVTAEGTTDTEYYLRQKSTGFITNYKTEVLWGSYETKAGEEVGTDATTATIKIDNVVPQISITTASMSGANQGKSYNSSTSGSSYVTDRNVKDEVAAENTIAMNQFAKDDVTFTISAADATSSNSAVDASAVRAIYYQLVSKHRGDSYDANGTWTPYTAPINVPADDRVILYVKVIDNAGNTTIMNTDGFIVYIDASEATPITYTRTTLYAQDTEVTFENNKVDRIELGGVALDNAEDSKYSVDYDNGNITFTGVYLDTLAASATPYEFIVHYKPFDTSYSGNGDAPETTTIQVTVDKADTSVAITDISNTTLSEGNYTQVYDGLYNTEPNYVITNTEDINGIGANLVIEDTRLSTAMPTPEHGAVTVEYKLGDGAYTTAVPKDAGTYTVRVSVAETPYYKPCQTTETLVIDKKAATVTAESKTKIYGNDDPELTWNVTGEENGETLDVGAVRTAGENVGDYNISLTADPTTATNRNYNITIVDSTHNSEPGTIKFTITKRPVTVTVDAGQH
nr:hypothetical protein [Lachnospiraceae bacterium]